MPMLCEYTGVIKIDLKPKKAMLTFLYVCIVSLALACFQISIHIYTHRPRVFLLLFIMAIIGIIAVTGAVIFDLISKSEKTIIAKIVSKEGRMINVVTEERKLKKYKIYNQEVREMLELDQDIEITLTKLTNFPIRIRKIDR